jgi:hypothetical protein
MSSTLPTGVYVMKNGQLVGAVQVADAHEG